MRWASLVASTGSMLAFYALLFSAAYGSKPLLVRSVELLLASSIFSVYSLAATVETLKGEPLLEDLAPAAIAGLAVTGVTASLLYTQVASAVASLVARRLRLVEEETGARLTPRTRLAHRPVLASLLAPILAPLIGYEAGLIVEASCGLSTLASLELLPGDVPLPGGEGGGEA